MLLDKVKIKKTDIYSLFLILLTFLIDRASKYYVIELIRNNEKEIYINDFLNITLNWNMGVGFGLFSMTAGIVYHIISALILLIIIYLIYLMVKSNGALKLIFALIIGGAAGNLFDRLTYFAVPDFIDLHFNSYHWFTFNFADIFITIGILFMIIYEIFFNKNAQ